MRKGLSASNLKGFWTNNESQPMERLTITTETAQKLAHRCHSMLHVRDLDMSSVFWFFLSWVLQCVLKCNDVIFMLVWGDHGVSAKEIAVDSVRLGSFGEAG